MEETEEEMGEMGEGMAVAGEEMAVEMAEETAEEMAEVIGNFENSISRDRLSGISGVNDCTTISCSL